ncbi:MAG TPA: hypothetical protein VGL13_09185 [Polyangiaceae bacterium]
MGGVWAVVLLVGCKQKPKDDPDPVPVVTATAAATAPAAAVSVADTAQAAAADTIPPPVQPVGLAPAPKAAAKPEGSTKAEAPKSESIGTCCTALHKEAVEAPKDKGLYQTAAASCDAIAKLVSTGTTKKSSALTQLRANLRGAKLPAGCE